MNKKFSIIIPVYNEKKNIEKLSKKIIRSLRNVKYEIIFVDDESTDGTIEILKKISQRKFINFFVRKNCPKDLSQSCFFGFKKSKYKNIIVMDGDLQHDPIFLNNMISKFNSKNLDFIVGSRNFKSERIKELSFLRYYASKFLINLFFLFVGKKTQDPMSGFFIFKKKCIRNNKIYFGRGYKILSDLLYSNVNKKYKVEDFPIKFRSRKTGSSKMNLKVLINIILFILFILYKQSKI